MKVSAVTAVANEVRQGFVHVDCRAAYHHVAYAAAWLGFWIERVAHTSNLREPACTVFKLAYTVLQSCDDCGAADLER